MPKILDHKILICELGGDGIWEYLPHTKKVFCKLCSIAFDISRRRSLKKHCKLDRHKKQVKLKEDGDSHLSQVPIESAFKRNSANSQFKMDLVNSCISSGIPFYKIENEEFILRNISSLNGTENFLEMCQ